MTPKQQTTEATGARKGPVNATAGRTPWGNQTLERHMYPSVHCSTIYNS